MQPTPQDNQLMSKHRVLSFKPQLRLEWRGQDGQNETEQPDHSASLGDSITSSTRIRFSVHTAALRAYCTQASLPIEVACGPRTARTGRQPFQHHPAPADQWLQIGLTKCLHRYAGNAGSWTLTRPRRDGRAEDDVPNREPHGKIPVDVMWLKRVMNTVIVGTY